MNVSPLVKPTLGGDDYLAVGIFHTFISKGPQPTKFAISFLTFAIFCSCRVIVSFHVDRLAGNITKTSRNTMMPRTKNIIINIKYQQA